MDRIQGVDDRVFGSAVLPAAHSIVSQNAALTGNPALGAAADLLVANGGTAILSETPEITDISKQTAATRTGILSRSTAKISHSHASIDMGLTNALLAPKPSNQFERETLPLQSNFVSP